jgi:hypothetical protein
MKTPFLQNLCLCATLAFGPFAGYALARGSDAGTAVKAAEARIRASQSNAAAKPKAVPAQAPSVAQENFFTKFAARFSRPAPKASGEREMPVVVVRESRPAPAKSEPADLGDLVAGILQRLGPMQLEKSDDAVMNPPSDSLALLSHPNIQPTVPVAPVPVPGQSGKKPLVNPLTEHRSSTLAAKVIERLEEMKGREAAMLARSAPKREATPVPVKVAPAQADPSVREGIELMAILAVSEERDAKPDVLAKRTESATRVGALSLLASAAGETASHGEGNLPFGPSSRPSLLREVPRYPASKLQPVPVIKPVREIDSSDRTRVLVLLQPDSLAGAP